MRGQDERDATTSTSTARDGAGEGDGRRRDILGPDPPSFHAADALFSLCSPHEAWYRWGRRGAASRQLDDGAVLNVTGARYAELAKNESAESERLPSCRARGAGSGLGDRVALCGGVARWRRGGGLRLRPRLARRGAGAGPRARRGRGERGSGCDAKEEVHPPLPPESRALTPSFFVSADLTLANELLARVFEDTSSLHVAAPPISLLQTLSPSTREDAQAPWMRRYVTIRADDARRGAAAGTSRWIKGSKRRRRTVARRSPAASASILTHAALALHIPRSQTAPLSSFSYIPRPSATQDTYSKARSRSAERKESSIPRSSTPAVHRAVVAAVEVCRKMATGHTKCLLRIQARAIVVIKVKFWMRRGRTLSSCPDENMIEDLDATPPAIQRFADAAPVVADGWRDAEPRRVRRYASARAGINGGGGGGCDAEDEEGGGLTTRKEEDGGRTEEDGGGRRKEEGIVAARGPQAAAETDVEREGGREEEWEFEEREEGGDTKARTTEDGKQTCACMCRPSRECRWRARRRGTEDEGRTSTTRRLGREDWIAEEEREDGDSTLRANRAVALAVAGRVLKRVHGHVSQSAHVVRRDLGIPGFWDGAPRNEATPGGSARTCAAGARASELALDLHGEVVGALLPLPCACRRRAETDAGFLQRDGGRSIYVQASPIVEPPTRANVCGREDPVEIADAEGLGMALRRKEEEMVLACSRRRRKNRWVTPPLRIPIDAMMLTPAVCTYRVNGDAALLWPRTPSFRMIWVEDGTGRGEEYEDQQPTAFSIILLYATER
ncbi:hypothetical protein DFH09DRAFT_1319929 [Mycena vulgaris]|nr:hypothetical protein DFH09DRAFT_1319929 [Mycena vulgaris]